MKISFILMPIVVILSLFSISQVYAKSSSDNTLKACIDAFMEKFDQAVTKLDQKLQTPKDKLTTESSEENNSTFLKRISTDACVSSYTQTGKFGHLLSAQDQEKFVSASFFKLMMETKNKMNK